MPTHLGQLLEADEVFCMNFQFFQRHAAASFLAFTQEWHTVPCCVYDADCAPIAESGGRALAHRQEFPIWIYVIASSYAVRRAMAFQLVIPSIRTGLAADISKRVCRADPTCSETRDPAFTLVILRF